MHRPLVHGIATTGLHQLAGIQDRHAVADGANGGQIVADEHVGHAKLTSQLGQQIEDRRADDGIERGSDFIAEDQAGFGSERACQVDAVLLAAGQLCG